MEAPSQRKESKPSNAKKLTYKEQQEFSRLESEIAALEKEKEMLEEQLGSGLLDPDGLQIQSERYAIVLKEIDAKTDRWIELSEQAGS